MIKLHEGQCGMCSHFGEQHASDDTLIQIRIKGEAPDAFVDECGHPQHAGLHLKVSANSGCDAFARASAA